MPLIRPVKATEIIRQGEALMREHWQETEADFCATPPAPVTEIYQSLEDANVVIGFGAFVAAVDDAADAVPVDELVGYAVAFITPQPHYGFIYAQHDVLFVRRDYRHGSLGVRLMRCVEAEARERGAKLVSWHAKPGSTMHMLLEKRRCIARDLVFTKEL